MCIARLLVSTQDCEHRWYELTKACHPANNLANCPEKLKLSGWENRTDSCLWCEAIDPKVHESTHRLFGGSSSASYSNSNTPPSPDLAISRSWSWRSTASDGTMSPLSRHSSSASAESDWGQKHRDMNERLDIYLSYHPHQVLPSAAKNYPTYASSQAKQYDSGSIGAPARRSSALSKRWRSMRSSLR